jgi:thiamine-monophosphate kinase
VSGDDRLLDVLSLVGERAALRRILPRLPHAADERLGPGDDAAVLAAPDGRLVLTTDVMVEGPDFRLAWSRPFELGWKAATTNFADVAAMGGVPTGLLVALTAPPSTPVALLEGIADGLAAACRQLAPGCGVLGGDLTTSPVLTLAITAVGGLDGRSPVRRDGARPADVLAYAGRLGLAALALRLLATEQDLDRLRRDQGSLLAEQLAPSPPLAAGPAAAAAGATAMLDVSDGLLLDAGRIAAASDVVLDLDGRALDGFADAVRSAAPALAEQALDLVLTGGEDHGLLACFPPDVALPAGFVRLGVVRHGAAEVLVDGAVPAGSSRPGWDSFTA